MKRGILVATLLMAAAGVASANLLTTAPQSVASPQPQPATEATRPVMTAGPEKSAIPPAPAAIIAAPLTRKGEPAPTAQKTSVEMRQAPVPFQLKPRPPVNLPPVADKDKDKATETKAPGQADDKLGEPSPDPAGEKAVRAAIEADGYKGVTVLRKGANGVWHASALRGKTTVMLTVDGSGSVSAD